MLEIPHENIPTYRISMNLDSYKKVSKLIRKKSINKINLDKTHAQNQFIKCFSPVIRGDIKSFQITTKIGKSVDKKLTSLE